jgi:hypothetical protein
MKINLSASGPKPHSAQMHSAGAVPAVARRWHTGDGGERWLSGAETAARRDGDRRAVSGTRRSGRHGFGPPLGQDGGVTGEAVGEAGDASEAGCRGPTAALSHGVGAARGSHAATARCRTGPARRAASDRWGPLVSDFRIKNYPERK